MEAAPLAGDDCGRALLRLLSRGHAIAAELQRAADVLPPTLAGEGQDFARLVPVLRDLSIFSTKGAAERIATTPELIELDEESRELHLDYSKRVFRVLAAIRKYATDLRCFFDDLESGTYVSHNLEEVACDPDGCQLISEGLALLGALLLLVDERLPGPARERTLVVFYRFTVGTNDEAEEFPDVCRLFRATHRPADTELATRPMGYPENFFARFKVPREVVRIIVGQLQTGDIYGAARHYPLPQHRSHSLAAQAGLLYVVLFFDNAQILQTDTAAMREIVNRHFGEAWVVAYALGFTADLLAMWAPYPAARQALAAAITATSVRQLQDQHLERLASTRQQLAEHLKEGALTEEVVLHKTSQLLSCLREANTSIRWLLLQPTTSDPKLQAVLKSAGGSSKEKLLQALVDTALLEDRIRSLLGPLVARRDADWAELKATASQSMDDLAVYFSGEHALRRKVRNAELEEWFRGLQGRIDALSYSTQEETLSLSRKVSQICRALEEVESFYEISQQPQILHFLADARARLQRMVRTVSLSQDTFQTIATVADLSYAWKALGAYQQTMHALLEKSSGSVKGLRALFVKLASILEAPLRRIRQARNEAHEELVSSYYSLRLEDFMRSVLQEIPRLIFGLLGQISKQSAARPPDQLPARLPLEELWAYAQKSEPARGEVAALTQRISQLVRGMREADVTVLGAVRVEPRAVLTEGLRRELAQRVPALLAGLSFPSTGRALTRRDVVAPLEALASKAESLRGAFENVQDYTGVSALRLWHHELGRTVRFLLHMEQHVLLRRRLLPASSSRFHDPDVPIAFPDGVAGTNSGGSFLSRTTSALLALTDPKTAVGGLTGEWRSTASGELLLDDLVLEVLHRAIGPWGLSGVSRLLGLGAARRVEAALAAVTAEARGLPPEMLAQAHAASGSRDVAKQLRASGQRFSTRPLLDVVVGLGQHQILRYRLQHVQRLHARLDAPLVAEALGALDEASAADAVDLAAQGNDLELPSLNDFLGEGPTTEQVSAFHRRVALAAELPGFGNPLRQLYKSMPPDVAPPGLGILLALLLLSNVPVGARRPEGSRTLFRGLLKSPAGAAPAEEPSFEATAPLVAGAATLLQQLPRSQTDEALEVLGLYLGSLCAEAAEAKDGRESWAEGARLLEMLGEMLELLGLPREHLAQFTPQGLLDLWPSE